MPKFLLLEQGNLSPRFAKFLTSFIPSSHVLEEEQHLSSNQTNVFFIHIFVWLCPLHHLSVCSNISSAWQFHSIPCYYKRTPSVLWNTGVELSCVLFFFAQRPLHYFQACPNLSHFPAMIQPPQTSPVLDNCTLFLATVKEQRLSCWELLRSRGFFLCTASTPLYLSLPPPSCFR